MAGLRFGFAIVEAFASNGHEFVIWALKCRNIILLEDALSDLA
jgi:hypothetical protein